jgi:ankyrin repeat protein
MRHCGPLFHALENKKYDAAILLIEHGADVNAKDILNGPMVYYFAKRYMCDSVNLLIKYGAIVDGRRLGLLIRANDNTIGHASFLLDIGADIDCVYNCDWTPLIRATYCSQMRIAKLLIERGANVNARRRNGLTPLFNACKRNELEIVKMLVERGANMHVKYSSRHTPLTIAQYHRHKEVVDYLTAYEQTKKS